MPRAKKQVAKVFWTGRSQAVRLPREFRFEGDSVLVHREGNSVILEPSSSWPDGWVESFRGIATDLKRPRQGRTDKRAKLP